MAEKRTRVERGLYVRAGTYFACAADRDGKTRWKSLGKVNLSAARRLRDEFAAEMQKSTKPVATKVTVAEVADLWNDEQRKLLALGDVRPRTYASAQDGLSKILPVLGSRVISTLEPDDIVAWHQEVRVKKDGTMYADWTVRRWYIVLRQVLGYAARHGYAATNPADALSKREVPKMGRRKVTYLEAPEIDRLLRCAKAGRYRLALMLGVFCGLRISEVVALRWQDISFEHNLVRVTGQIDKLKPEDGPREMVRVEFAKTDAGHREVVLMDALVRFLKEHKLASRFSGSADYVICTEAGTIMDPDNLRSRGFAPAVKASGVKATFHTLRHTYASIMIGQGHDAVYVASQMGHAKPSVTLDTYSHLFARQRHADNHRARLDEEFGGMVGGL